MTVTKKSHSPSDLPAIPKRGGAKPPDLPAIPQRGGTLPPETTTSDLADRAKTETEKGKEKETEGTKVFVRGLGEETTNKELQEAFASFGEIEKVFVVKDKKTKKPRGFGFVIFKSEEDAKKAIEAMNGKQWKGETLVVNVAKEKKEGGEADKTDTPDTKKRETGKDAGDDTKDDASLDTTAAGDRARDLARSSSDISDDGSAEPPSGPPPISERFIYLDRTKGGKTWFDKGVAGAWRGIKTAFWTPLVLIGKVLHKTWKVAYKVYDHGLHKAQSWGKKFGEPKNQILKGIWNFLFREPHKPVGEREESYKPKKETKKGK
ncbi:MAG: hypothetical protein UU08_C0037G0003 [Candidatus Uhrbacteria bacterium GW2011_GWE2_40_58]|nr:MAG: hypothetical protein UT94_C0060G0002 [Candidatus Uhrbacteria bacterium GW2011_GWF2_40_263]KKR66640.1 MAG: hypothetical protein UU08_C0037G0003 [Candidatus Uhrbacteria bacterium GW2011_GWE2_40_58]OGL93765.1 MAG: hypothetical protein A2239_02815 [Candidatus Uhrbacteria bacterium RIFOXYA2_FULL_40_9]OGL97633.1 MAG: hypothetical protein A2332_01865 [Candidatus Uhrbacteria bacterium RIFOXYB2_FULL_41_18]HBK34823.1 hypothetical protein [Candidatus Uhrbacteria bacterium]